MDPKIKKLVKIYGVATLLVIVLGIGSQNSILFVSKPSGANDYSASVREQGKNEVSKRGFGIKLVSTGNYIVDISSPTGETRKYIKTLPFWIHRVNVQTEPQKNVAKIATNADQCVYGDRSEMVSGIVYSYDCYSLGQPLKNDFFQNIEKEPLETFYNLSPSIMYRGGVAGIRQIASEEEDRLAEFLWTKNPGNTKRKSVPELNSIVPENTYMASNGSSIAVLDSRENKIAIFSNIESAISSKTISIEGPSQDKKIISFKYFNESIYLYSVKPYEEEGEAAGEAELSIYSASDGKKTSNYQINDIRIINEELGEFELLNDRVLVSSSSDEGGLLYIFELDKKNIKKIDAIKETKDSLVFNNKLYALSFDGKVYRYDPVLKEGRLVFGSENTKISSIYTNGADLVLNGSAELDTNKNSLTFLVLESDLKTLPRPADVLPLGDEYNGVPTTLVDFIGDQIYIYEPPLGYNNDSKDNNQKYIEGLLKETGLELSKYKIVKQ